ncbi:MAG: twin-arginine translocase subunit TatC [Planctomycetota bacterium]
MSEEETKENLKSMSLGDHLEELRARLILMILGIVVGLIATLFFGTHLVSFLKTPYYNAMKRISMQKSESLPSDPNDLSFRNNLVCITVSEHNIHSMKSLKPGDHFLAQVQFYRDDPNNSAFTELKMAPGNAEFDRRSVKGLRTLRLQEGMLVYLKVCFVFGFILVCPWVFWQMWAFVSAGLYQHEKKFVHVVVPISALLFITGTVFFMTVVAPLAMSFFMRFDRLINVESDWTLQYYMNFVLMLTLVFGAAFQMPIAIVFAEMMGLVSIENLTKSRKFVILALLFIAAVATPPDVISQVLLAAPLYVLYEASIVVCRILRKRKEQSS